MICGEREQEGLLILLAQTLPNQLGLHMFGTDKKYSLKKVKYLRFLHMESFFQFTFHGKFGDAVWGGW